MKKTIGFLTFFGAFLLFQLAPIFVCAQEETDDEIIKVETNLVVLNAVVTDAKGKYVEGLRQADFKIFEDGREQQIETFGAESTPFAAVVLLDTSGSMEARIALARSAAIKFLEGLRAEDVAAVYNFDSKINLVQEFSPLRDLAPTAFNLAAKGMTVLNDAVVEAAKTLAERPERRRAIIVLSDGADTLSKTSQDKALRAALAANATVYTVDMAAIEDVMRGGAISTGNSNRRLEKLKSIGALKMFAEKSGGRFVPVAGGTALRDAFAQIVAELSVQYTIGYQPSNSVKDGKWRAIEVKLNNTRAAAQVRSRKGYNAPKK